jgi:hypothetical protein
MAAKALAMSLSSPSSDGGGSGKAIVSGGASAGISRSGARLGDRAAQEDGERAALSAFALELLEQRRAIHAQQAGGLLLVAA